MQVGIFFEQSPIRQTFRDDYKNVFRLGNFFSAGKFSQVVGQIVGVGIFPGKSCGKNFHVLSGEVQTLRREESLLQNHGAVNRLERVQRRLVEQLTFCHADIFKIQFGLPIPAAAEYRKIYRDEVKREQNCRPNFSAGRKIFRNEPEKNFVQNKNRNARNQQSERQLKILNEGDEQREKIVVQSGENHLIESGMKLPVKRNFRRAQNYGDGQNHGDENFCNDGKNFSPVKNFLQREGNRNRERQNSGGLTTQTFTEKQRGKNFSRFDFTQIIAQKKNKTHAEQKKKNHQEEKTFQP